MKATSVFGGVQIFQIIINIIRSKIISIWLGPQGFGLFSMFSQPINLIREATGLGLNTSAVKDISQANETGQTGRISRIAAVFRRWAFMTGLLGSAVTMALAPWLSRLMFSGPEYTWTFVWLSVTLLLRSVSDGEATILRGMRRITDLARASLWGSVIGLLTSLPLYYFFGNDGIAPSIIVAALTALLLNLLYSRRIRMESVEMTAKETFREGLPMARLGFILALSGIITLLVSNLIIIFIGQIAPDSQTAKSQVGLYQSSFTIINQYVGLVFTAMAADYFPKLAATATDNIKMRSAANQQSEITLLLSGPMIALLLLTAPLVLRIFFSAEFVPVTGLLQWASCGIILKAISWPMSFILLAKGNSKFYLLVETVFNIVNLITTIIGYRLWGLEGIGVAYLISYAVYLAVVYFVVRRKYGFRVTAESMKISIIFAFTTTLCFLAVYVLGGIYGYITAGLVTAATLAIAFKELNRRIEFKGIIKSLRNRNK